MRQAASMGVPSSTSSPGAGGDMQLVAGELLQVRTLLGGVQGLLRLLLHGLDPGLPLTCPRWMLHASVSQPHLTPSRYDKYCNRGTFYPHRSVMISM
jgi:hypothetical protein